MGKGNKPASDAEPVAKKKRKDEAELNLPEFNEVEYMKTEMKAARAAIVAVIWAVPAALVSWGFTIAGIAIVAFFAGLGIMFLLKWIYPLVRVDTSQWKRRDWMGHGVTFFFSWLAFWILLLNPPFSDLTNPVITGVTVDGRAVPNICGALTSVPAGSHYLNVTAGDNVGVGHVTLVFGGGNEIEMAGGPGNPLWTYYPWTTPTTGPRTVTIVAKDLNGHLSAPCVVTVTPNP